MLLALTLWTTLALDREIDLKGSLGATSFLDDSAENHLLTGGSARIYLTRRFSFEPELLFLYQSAQHHDWVVLPNFAWDFRTGRVRPYVTGGVGWLRFTQKFRGGPPAAPRGFSQSQWHVSAGFGVKVYLNDRWFVAPEFRTGFEPHGRLSVGVGYTLR